MAATSGYAPIISYRKFIFNSIETGTAVAKGSVSTALASHHLGDEAFFALLTGGWRQANGRTPSGGSKTTRAECAQMLGMYPIRLQV